MIVFTSCGREVLRLVDDDVLLRQAATADVRERLDLDLPALEQLGVGARALARPAREEELEVVEDGLHPGVELLVDVAGEEADVAPERHDRTRHEHARVGAVFDGPLEAGGEREQRLAGAGLADQRDQADGLVEQQVDGEALLLVARAHAHHALARHAKGRDGLLGARRSGRAPCARGCVRSRSSTQRVRRRRRCRAAASVPVAEERVDLLAVDVELDDAAGRAGRPRRAGSRRSATTMPSASARMRRLVSIVTKTVGRPPSCLAHVERRLQDGLVHGRVVDGARQLEAAARARRRGGCPPTRACTPAGERAALVAQLVEEARDVPRVAPALRALALELVDLLDDVDGDDDVVVLEPEDRARDRGGGRSCRGRSSSSSGLRAHGSRLERACAGNARVAARRSQRKPQAPSRYLGPGCTR